MKISKTFFIAIMLLMLLAFSAARAALLVDPEIPSSTRLIYDIEVPQENETFEYHNLIDKIKAEQGAAYLINSFVPSAEAEDRGQVIYLIDPYVPLFCNYTFKNNRKKYSYHKSMAWDWGAKKCEIVEVVRHPKKEERTERTMDWKDDPYLDFALIFNGLLNGLPISEKENEARLKLSLKWFTAKVVFKLVSREAVAAAGRNWECYKIEATPDLGALLNWVRIFWGNPKSYIWLTVNKPKIVVMAHIRAPGIERIAKLKMVEMGRE
jgi:hypothetical protein